MSMLKMAAVTCTSINRTLTTRLLIEVSIYLELLFVDLQDSSLPYYHYAFRTLLCYAIWVSNCQHVVPV